MAAPANNDEFLDLVRKSGVTDEKRLDAHVQRARRLASRSVEALRDALLGRREVDGIRLQPGADLHRPARRVIGADGARRWAPSSL